MGLDLPVVQKIYAVGPLECEESELLVLKHSGSQHV